VSPLPARQQGMGETAALNSRRFYRRSGEPAQAQALAAGWRVLVVDSLELVLPATDRPPRSVHPAR